MFVVASCRECDWELEPADATAKEQRRQHRLAEKHTNEEGHATVAGCRPLLPS